MHGSGDDFARRTLCAWARVCGSSLRSPAESCRPRVAWGVCPIGDSQGPMEMIQFTIQFIRGAQGDADLVKHPRETTRTPLTDTPLLSLWGVLLQLKIDAPTTPA